MPIKWSEYCDCICQSNATCDFSHFFSFQNTYEEFQHSINKNVLILFGMSMYNVKYRCNKRYLTEMCAKYFG